MATYRKRKTRWQVQVRQLGHRPISRSFHTKADAEIWARGLEAQIDRAALPPNYGQLKTIRLEELIGRYLELVSPRKKSHYKERCRLLRLQKTAMAGLTLDKVTPAVFARFRDERLSQVGAQAIRHDLNVLGHMFKIAIREWGIPMTSNPIELIANALAAAHWCQVPQWPPMPDIALKWPRWAASGKGSHKSGRRHCRRPPTASHGRCGWCHVACRRTWRGDTLGRI